jgi:hypothetical protein
MTKESLEKAREIVVFSLMDSNLDIVDRTELIMNLDKFLNPVEYEDNIKVLTLKNK